MSIRSSPFFIPSGGWRFLTYRILHPWCKITAFDRSSCYISAHVLPSVTKQSSSPHLLISLFYSSWWMEVLDSPNFAPLVQNYKQLRKSPPTVGAPIPLAQVQRSSLATKNIQRSIKRQVRLTFIYVCLDCICGFSNGF